MLAAALSQSAVGPAVAQTDQAGTGGAPASTERAPDTTAAGQTRPPNREVAPTPDGKRDVQLDELRTNATPRQQADLDTVALASARRERARSMDDKTNGLWQSWLVSICEGCGDQKPTGVRKPEDQPGRDASMTTGSVDRKPAQDRARPEAMDRPGMRRHGSVAADLSNGSIGMIRRAPQ